MATIAVRKNGNAPVVAAQPFEYEWEPARMMRRLLDWDPFREMAPYVPEAPAVMFAPSFDVKETNEAYVFKADMPGVKEADLEIMVTGNRLGISGKREAEREEKGERFYTYERSFGRFTRSFTLPDGADLEKISAELKEGVLTILLPKKPELQPKKVEVNAGPKA